MEILIYVLLVVLIVLGALSVIPRSNSKGKGNGAHPLGSGETSRSYTKKEVSTHNTRKDCWIIIKDKVYDVTSYVEEHPGGDAILNNAGDDSTEGFFGHKTWIRILCLPEIHNSELDGEPSKKTILKYLHEHVHKFINEITNPDVTIDAAEPLKLPQHGTRVFDIIEDFCIGELKD